MNMIKVDIQFEHIHPLGCSFGDKSSTRCRMEKLKAVEHILVCAELLHQYLTHVTYVVFRRLEMWHRPWLMCITVCSFCKISPLISVCLHICLSVSVPGFNHGDASSTLMPYTYSLHISLLSENHR